MKHASSHDFLAHVAQHNSDQPEYLQAVTEVISTPSVNLSILKFLAFEQTFKNALTTLPMGFVKVADAMLAQGVV